MNWITANHMGSFQRVFVSLDELFSCFDATTGFCGYDSQALANLDDALSIIAAAHQKVDLVLFLEDNTAGFHFEALDGYHPQMEQSYVTAVPQFVQHVAANATDSSAISVIDLQNEAYYQIAAHLSTMTNVCGQDTGCIDHKISYPWLTQLYNTAHAAAPQFKYTASACHCTRASPMSTTFTSTAVTHGPSLPSWPTREISTSLGLSVRPAAR